MISALAWVPRGAMKRTPLRHDPAADELEAARARGAAAGEEDDSDDELSGTRFANDAAFDSLKGVKLPPGIDDSSDDDEGGNGLGGGDVRMSGARGDRGARAGGGGAVEALDGSDSDEEESEAEDLEARPSDAFVIVANTQDEYSSLEVYSYNEDDGSLFVRHDITLPSFPVCVAWMDYAGDVAGAPLLRARGAAPTGDGMSYVGSFAAVGTFDPSIEVWGLDVVDPLEPTLILKGATNGKAGKKGKGGKKGGGAPAAASAAAGGGGSTGGHEGAVLSLSWNRVHRHMLASASADGTAKIWDLDAGGRVLHTYRYHGAASGGTAKVTAIAWNPVEATVLATASADRTLAVTDARAASANRVARYGLSAAPESLLWYTHDPAVLIASLEDGAVVAFDSRVPDTPLWTLAAHGQATTSLAVSEGARGLLATASLDKTVRLWDMGASSVSSAPVLLSSKAMAIGQVFTVSFFSSSASGHLLAAGGSKGLLAVWDTAEDAGDVTSHVAAAGDADGSGALARHFGGRQRTTAPPLVRARADGQALPVAR